MWNKVNYCQSSKLVPVVVFCYSDITFGRSHQLTFSSEKHCHGVLYLHGFCIFSQIFCQESKHLKCAQTFLGFLVIFCNFYVIFLSKATILVLS